MKINAVDDAAAMLMVKSGMDVFSLECFEEVSQVFLSACSSLPESVFDLPTSLWHKLTA